MDLSLVGTQIERTKNTKRVHCRHGREVQDASPCPQSGRRHASHHQRWGYPSRRGSILWSFRPFSSRSETRRGGRTNHSQYACFLSKHDLPTHSTQMGRCQTGRSAASVGARLASQARPLTQIQRPYPFSYASPVRQGDALGIGEHGSKSDGPGRGERYQQAQETPTRIAGERRMANPRLAGSTLPNYRANRTMLRLEDQRNPRSALGGLQLRPSRGTDSEISSREAAQQTEDGVFAGRSPARTRLHPRIEEMANSLRRFRSRLALPKSCHGSSVSRRLDPRRLPRPSRSSDRTRKDRLSHVPPYLSCMAGRNRSSCRRAAKTDAARARFHNDGSVRQCLYSGEAQGQPANRATRLEKVNHSTSLAAISKGTASQFPYWTVLDSRYKCPIARNPKI